MLLCDTTVCTMLKATAFSLPIKVENTIRGRGKERGARGEGLSDDKVCFYEGANLHNPSPSPTFFYFPLPSHVHTVAPSLLLEAALTTFGTQSATACLSVPPCTAATATSLGKEES